MVVFQFGAVVHQSVRRVRSSRQLWLFHICGLSSCVLLNSAAATLPMHLHPLHSAELSSGDAPFVPLSRFNVRRANRPS